MEYDCRWRAVLLHSDAFRRFMGDPREALQSVERVRKRLTRWAGKQGRNDFAAGFESAVWTDLASATTSRHGATYPSMLGYCMSEPARPWAREMALGF
jgi:hypothetical protein